MAQRKSIRIWWLWYQQGCPRDVPVVLSAGRLIVHEDGTYVIQGWSWDFRYQTTPVEAGDLWDRLSAQVPVERPR